jgi:SOS response regulatory protein OraA/RecX
VRITYTHHARQRMAQRGISEAEVAETLEAPDDILQGDEQEEIAIKQFGAREVQVVYEEAGGEAVVVITVMQEKSQT